MFVMLDLKDSNDTQNFSSPTRCAIYLSRLRYSIQNIHVLFGFASWGYFMGRLLWNDNC